jgi:glycosyltransferase involved in cell wall biosynthesis
MKFSVITVTYKDPLGLKRTLESLLPVGRDGLLEEVIVVDSSPAHSTEVVARLSPELPIRHLPQPPEGIYAAMNFGWRESKGEILWFLNGGDEACGAEPLRAVLKAFADTPAVSIVGARAALASAGSVRYHHPAPLSLFAGIRRGNGFCHQATFYRRAPLMALYPFRIQFRLAADFDLHVRCAAAGFEYARLKDVVAIYDTDGLSANVDKVLREYDSVIRENRGIFSKRSHAALRMGVAMEALRVRTVKRLGRSSLALGLRPIWLRWKEFLGNR